MQMGQGNEGSHDQIEVIPSESGPNRSVEDD